MEHGWFICSLLHGLIFLAFIWRFPSSARYVSCTGDHAKWAEIRGSFFSTFASGGNRSTEVRSDREKLKRGRRQQRPVTEDSDATIEITRKKKSSDGERKRHVRLVDKGSNQRQRQPFPVMLHLGALVGIVPVLLRLLTVTQQSEIILRHLGKNG